jgi:hypothetical protein
MRQLSFAFLRSGRHATELPASVAAPAQPVTLRRIDPAKNMARFYSLEVERDLFGRIVLVRRWAASAQQGRSGWMNMQGRGRLLPPSRR